MGRDRINKLLDQLKENQEKEVQVDAAIFATSQVAVDLLKRSQQHQLKTQED